MKLSGSVLTGMSLALAWLVPCETRADEAAETISVNRARAGELTDSIQADDEAVRPEAEVQDARATDKPLTETPPAQAVAGTRDRAVIADPGTPSSTEVFSLPGGADKTGVSAKAISVPKGSGTIRGMEESFSAELSTGIASFSFPFALPEARGGVTPTLGLQYSSASGAGVAGLGWSLSVPFIARQTDKGPPKYVELEGGFVAEQDQFVFNGGQELVPICVVGDQGGCSAALVGEVMPIWAQGWQYFRPRVEGGFQRFFWSPNHDTWRVQDKGGTTLELGVPLDGSGYTGALEQNPDRVSEIYRWYLVRKYDGYGAANPPSGNPAPVNVAIFRYLNDRGAAYLSDVFDTPPAADPTTGELGKFAHHTRLIYEPRSDTTHSYRSGYRIDQGLRLRRVEVASKTFAGGPNGVRRRVRRYHLGYEPGFRTSHLATIEVEGRCAGDEEQAPSEAAGPSIEDPMRADTQGACTGAGSNPNCSCPSHPPIRFGYSHVTPAAEESCSIPAGLDGFEGFDGRVREIADSPPHSADEDHVDFFDFNADALPDILVTAPGVYGRDHGLFCNGAGGTADAFGAARPLGISAVLGATSSDITLRNPNLAPLDQDGDGVVDLLHMPATRTYSIYSPSGGCAAPRWIGREVRTASGQSPKIDFGRDAAETRLVDVDFDGLLDVVVSTGTELQTFFSLGRHPGGDGQFGSARATGQASSDIDNDPVRTCVPSAGEPVRFSDADTRFADMNGDGIADIVRLRRGDIRYWPGRGNGVFGTGLRDDCPAGTFGNDRHVSMVTSPHYSDIQGTTLHVDDVNGDGFADLVQNRFDAVDIWLNDGGIAWTERHTLCGTPASPSFSNRLRLLDVNGSGTADIVWANAERYRYVDLQGGERPGLLVRIENGLGKSTDIEYSTSTAEMLEAEQGEACNPASPPADPFSATWCSKMPIVAHVVKRVTDSDNLNAFGRQPNVHVAEYTYRDPVYDGVQREFRGFRHVRARNVGDANSPTDITDTTFLLGECVAEESGDCSPAGDNPREALKGLPIFTERHEEAGTYLSTGLVTYRLRLLYRGLDGRHVRQAFASSQRNLLYDTDATPFPAEPPGHATAGVELESTPGSVTSVLSLSVPKRSTSGHAEILSTTSLDGFGNSIESVAQGCVSGSACATGAQGALAEVPRDEVITTRSVPGRPNGDPTGWLWRTVESYVTGSAHLDSSGAPERRGYTVNTYNTEGALVEVHGVLRGSLPLLRFHQPDENGVVRTDLAPVPTDASVDGTVLISTSEYDTFGNLTRQTGPNGRCSDLGYEGSNTRPAGTPASGYDQFPTSETVYTGGCGVGGLTSSASLDRGFSVVTVVTDMTDQQTITRYDGFGRVVSQTKPDPTGAVPPEALPSSMTLDYFSPADLGVTSYAAIRTRTQDGANPSVASYLEAWTFVDGMGRPIAALSEAEESGTWVVSERQDFNAKLAVLRKYQPHFYSGAPQGLAGSPRVSVPYASQVYDAFGRQVATFDIDGTMTLLNRYHALSADHFDAADLDNGPHQGTPAREQSDGHNRGVVATGTIHVGSSVEEQRTVIRYLPTGEPEIITRVRVGTSGAPVTRFMRYDTLGRMVLNVEPNTSVNFVPDPAQSAAGLKAWRYAYDDAGDVVGTSDARGCGVNFAYDRAGRVVSEDYSPCEPSHPTYSPPVAGGGAEGLEVLHVYDSVPLFTGLDPPAEIAAQDPRFSRGRPTAVFDRASVSFPAYDGRGRILRTAVRVARPDSLSALPQDRYAPHWYQKVFGYDAADRETLATTGVDVAELLGGNAASAVTTEYTARGTVARIGGSYGEVVHSIEHDADGQTLEIVRGDAASTTTSFTYDERRRMRSVQTYRSSPPIWSSPPSNYLPPPPSGQDPTTLQLLLQDQDITYDVVNNPIEIRDYRTPEEWPDGAKPVTRKMRYDDFYRLIRIEHEYAGGSDDWVSPFAAENGTDNAFDDPRRADPSPHVVFDGRILHQTFQYDWLGNTTRSADDAGGFYDRSLGTIQNGTANAGSYQLKSASLTGARGGSLAALYDASGNLTRLDVRRNGQCLPEGASCSQRFAYDWDEVGRLVRARRWDVAASSVGTPSAPLPQTPPAADLRHAYDATNDRVLKNATDGSGVQRHTAYVFDSLELRGSGFDGTDYTRDASTQVAYLIVNGQRLARLVHAAPEAPSLGAARLHVFLEITDHLGSTSIVIDQSTGELVERSTYQAYGGAESDYRPERWQAFREDYRFTGKEEDVEVGIQYFGKRFCAPLLGRWMSADPLAIHAPGNADSNVYAIVSGKVLRAVDPLGLAEDEPRDAGVSAGVSDEPQPIESPDLPAKPWDTSLEEWVHETAARMQREPEQSDFVPLVDQAIRSAGAMAGATWDQIKSGKGVLRLGIGKRLFAAIGIKGFIGVEFEPRDPWKTLNVVGEVGGGLGVGAGLDFGRYSPFARANLEEFNISGSIDAKLNLGPLQWKHPLTSFGDPDLRLRLGKPVNFFAGVSGELSGTLTFRTNVRTSLLNDPKVQIGRAVWKWWTRPPPKPLPLKPRIPEPDIDLSDVIIKPPAPCSVSCDY